MKNKQIITLFVLCFFLFFLFGCSAVQEEPADVDPDPEIVNDEPTETVPDEPDPDVPVEDEKEERDRAPPVGKLEVHFIDVGQGDSILIKADNNVNILIDGGDRGFGNKVVNYLRNQGAKELDLVVGSHAHADHVGGLIQVLENIPVKEVLDPGVSHTTITFEDYLDAIDKSGAKFTEARAGMSYDFGSELNLSIVHPVSPSADHLNNSSVVIRLAFGDISFLFTGDIEREAEREILRRNEFIDSTVLKQPHHGSRTSGTKGFLEAVNPEVSVIMCGLNNRYGHPHEETLKALYDFGIAVYRTDKQGTIVIETDGRNYTVNQSPYVYDPDIEVAPDPEPTAAINLNTASFEELQEIVHIGPSRAEEIIALRPLDSLDSLLQVTGIGPARLEDIKEQGLACIE